MTTTSDERARRLATLPMETTAPDASLGGTFRHIRDIFSRRELMNLLVRRELSAKYKNSSLGFLWTLIRPLTMLLIYFVAIGQFLGAARNVVDFGVFVFAGLTIWALFSETVNAGTQSIINNAGLIKKVYLPREIFPLAATGSSLFNFGVQLIVLLVATLAVGRFPLTPDLGYSLAGILLMLVYGVAIALLLSALNVYLRDIQYLVEVGLLIMFWATPIVYPWSFVVQASEDLDMSWIADVYILNPLAVAVMAFQRGMWLAGSETNQLDGKTIDPQPWPADFDLRIVIMVVVGLAFLAVAQRVFAKLQGNFAQEI